MEAVSLDLERGHFRVGDLAALLVGTRVQVRIYLQTGVGFRRSDEVDNRLIAGEWSPAPVGRDLAKEPMLDLVPLARARGIVRDAYPQAGLVREVLQLQLPESAAVAVAPTTVGGDQ